MIVGADGSNGITRKSVFPGEPIYTARVLEVITPITNNTHKTDHAYFDFHPVPNNIAGYIWDFPTIVNGQPMRCCHHQRARLVRARAPETGGLTVSRLMA